jgi:hypothetical protein
MAETKKCAHLGCNCEVKEGGPWGKYCSPLCQEAGDEIVEVLCECGHPPCRAA